MDRKLLGLSDPRICVELKCPYSYCYKDPEGVVLPETCYFENGGPGSTAKKKVFGSGRRGALLDLSTGGLSTRTQGIAARCSLVSTTRLPHQAIAVMDSKNLTS